MKIGMMLGVAALLSFGTAGAGQAQIRTMDPNQASDLAPVPASESGYGTNVSPQAPAAPAPAAAPSTSAAADAVSAEGAATPADPTATTYAQDDVLSAAEGVFGRGAEGLAKLIEKLFKEQGRPNAYIAGREAGAAVVVGVRYGSGTLFHKVEGQLPVYWTGPSLGLDLGANGSKTFVLVYNLFDGNDIYQRFPGVEGSAYVVGGFTATYLRRGDVVLIPIRLGVGWRLGVNVGYMNFTAKSKVLPF